MGSLGMNARFSFAAGLMAVGLSFPAASAGQGVSNSTTQIDGRQSQDQLTEQYLQQNLSDPKQEAAYQAFHKLSTQDADKKIRLGQDFLGKYPSGPHTQGVYEELVQTYYVKQDLPDFYTYSDKGLSLFPDNVALLTLTGWVIPRAYSHDDPDGDKKLEKAVIYEKHALTAISAMPKPSGMSNQQFDQYKTGESAIAHSGLGLVYFRRGQYEDSVKELQAAIQNSAKPDQTDFYVLGADFENLNQHNEAADAFSHCAQIDGGLRDNCKKFAQSAKAETTPTK
jgi:tetratricopeptide (TPR) repeat protein